MLEIPYAEYLGKEIRTVDGTGILIGISVPSNGLYCSPERATYTVWYGTENSQNGWVSREYWKSDLDDAR